MRGNELCPRFERVNMVQTKFIYRFKAISIKIPIVCVCVNLKANSKTYGNVKNNDSYENIVGELARTK